MPIRTYFPGRGTMIEQALLEGEAKGRAEGRAEGLVEGRAEGRRLAVVRVLRTRDIDISLEARERIFSCTDLDALERWLDRAFIVATAEELFSEQD
ncbi:hypothetical protein [Streptomyces olivoreticuli]|uniref:hypothetical protein n=1 Tax=Streptomyces olivoreticuli TaxID=68246 RepID=UPI0013C2B92B|nr:hypothetical protein [Streptomyces olivoreticuli]